MLQRSANTFLDQLAEINSPIIKEVRGKGLLIGVELRPEAGAARGAIAKYCASAASSRRKRTSM